jgi:hypothetical protein
MVAGLGCSQRRCVPEHVAATIGLTCRKRIHVTLPADLPRRFTIRATTRPVPGEANTSNNRATWRVAIPE